MRLIKVPSEQGSLGRNRGCRDAPDAIAKALGAEAEAVEVVENNIEETDKAICSRAKELFEAGEQCIFLGGDHSITYSIFSAFSDVFGKDSALVVLDAHADAASFFKPVSHEDMNKVLVEEGKVKKENLLLVGMRKVWPVEKKWLREKKIMVIGADEVKKNFSAVKKNVDSFCKRQKNIYLSVDVDVFSPEIMPATGYLEKDGLNEKEFFNLFDALLQSKKVKAADFVEYNPQKDADGRGLELAVRIIDKIHFFL